MKRTIYIINAILFMGCCLLVSTTTPDVKDIDVNNKITYVNSDAIKKEEVIEVVPLEVIPEVVEEEPVVEEVQEEVVEEKPKEDVVVGKDEVIEDNTPIDSKPNEEVYIPPDLVNMVVLQRHLLHDLVAFAQRRKERDVYKRQVPRRSRSRSC